MSKNIRQPTSPIIWKRSEENCRKALLTALNAERFYIFRSDKQKYYWSNRRKVIARFYESKFGQLPAYYQSRNLWLKSGKLRMVNQELFFRDFMRRNKVYR